MLASLLDSVDVQALLGLLGLDHFLELGLVNPLLLCELLATDNAVIGLDQMRAGRC